MSLGLVMTKCEIKGCELVSKFHGFGHDYCWLHYSQFMTSAYRACDLANPSFRIGENKDGQCSEAQLKLW